MSVLKDFGRACVEESSEGDRIDGEVGWIDGEARIDGEWSVGSMVGWIGGRMSGWLVVDSR